MSVDSTATALAERLEALAVALREAGIAPERAASMLGAASAATLHAVTLVALLRSPVPAVAPAPAVEEPAEQQLPLAA
jgi:hypothetical protein